MCSALTRKLPRPCREEADQEGPSQVLFSAFPVVMDATESQGCSCVGAGAPPWADSLGESAFALGGGGRESKAPCSGGRPSCWLEGGEGVGGRGGRNLGLAPRTLGAMEGFRHEVGAGISLAGEGQIGAGVRGGVGRPWAAAGGDGEKSRVLSASPGTGGPPRHLDGGCWRWHLTLACGCRCCCLSHPAQRSSGVSRMAVPAPRGGWSSRKFCGGSRCVLGIPGSSLCPGAVGRWAGTVWTSSPGPRVLGACFAAQCVLRAVS